MKHIVLSISTQSRSICNTISIGINALHDFESKVPLEMDIGRTKFHSSFFFILKYFVRYDNDPHKKYFHSIHDTFRL